MKCKQYTINDVCNLVTDYVANGSFKALADNVTYLDNKGYARLIRLVDYNSNYDEKNAVWIDKESYEFLKKSKLFGNEVIVSNVGAYLGTVFKCPSLDYPMSLGPNSIILKTDKKICNQNYLYYYLKSHLGYSKLMSIISGSAMPKFNKTELKKIKIELPSVDVQNKVVNLLMRIDEKISMNNEINNNLHELINTLYKELFSRLNDDNSKTIQLKEISKEVLGGTPSRTKKEYWNGNINWINSGEINKFRILSASEKITELGLKKSSTVLLPQRTTVVAITGATLGQVSRLEIDSCANQSVIGIVPNSEILNNYIYLYVLNNVKDLISNQTGGAQQHINKNDVETFKIKLPNNELIQEFNLKVNSMFEKIKNNCFENISLEQLRDTLLPKLMNGEIDLDKIEI